MVANTVCSGTAIVPFAISLNNSMVASIPSDSPGWIPLLISKMRLSFLMFSKLKLPSGFNVTICNGFPESVLPIESIDIEGNVVAKLL